MTKTAERFASVVNGRLVALTEAFPPHELKDNQIELTRDEFTLLKSLPIHTSGANPIEGIQILQSIRDKMYIVENV